MITDLYITNPGGSTLNLNLRTSKDDHGILVFNLTGLGSPTATVTGLTGPNYDGIRGYFVKADARHLLLTLAIPVRGSSLEEFAKDLVYDHFQVKGEIIFRVKTESEDRWILGIVESVEMNQFSKVENAVISIYCPDPWFIDSFEKYEYATYGGLDLSYNYEGDVPVGANILITNGPPYSWGGGPTLGTLTLSNDRGGQSLVWPFVSFGEADKFIIDTRLGQKIAWHYLLELDTWYNITTEIIGSGEWLKLHPGANNLSVSYTGNYEGSEPNRPDPANLVGYWPLNKKLIKQDEPADIELVTGAYSVFPNGTYELSEVGKYYPYARKFTATSGILEWDDRVGENWNITGSFSVSFWFKRADVGNYRGILEYLASQETKNGFTIHITSGGVLQFIIYRNETAYTRNITVSGAGVWQFVTCYYDSTIDTMYIQLNNGIPVSLGSVLEPNYTDGGIMRIGRAGNWNFYGLIESVALYNKILTTAERTFLYGVNGRGMGYAGVIEEIEIILDYVEKYQGV